MDAEGARTFVGKWWLPEDPDKTVGGVLTVDRSGECHLQLVGSLLPNPYIQTESAPAPTGPTALVLGSAGDEDFSLLYAWVHHMQWLVEDAPQELVVNTVLRGVHVETADQECFTGAKIEIDNLTAWSGITGFTSGKEYDEPAAGAPLSFARAYWELRTPSEPSPVGQLGDFDVELVWRSEFSTFIKDRNIRREVSATEDVHAKISSPRPVAWGAFKSRIKVLQDLLTFATRHPCAVRTVNLIHDDEEVGQVELLNAPQVKPAEDQPTQIFRYVFRLKDMPLDELLRKWHAMYTEIGMGIHVLFGLDYNKNGFIENQILNATSAAESIHRALRPDARSIPPDGHASLVATVREKITHEHKNWLLGRLKNTPGFAERARELVKIPSSAAVAALLEDADLWVTWARDGRNATAHHEGGDFERIPEGARWGLPAATLGLLHLVLLAELGFSEEVQLAAAQGVYGQQAERFRRAVKERRASSQASL
ncbi:MAG TPA: HEPN domain-containing protein [Sinomonas sp.]|nr:HEPN domain-containing protein [Sinomonas sp.]